MFCMKAKEGRKKSVRALVAVGNGKGAAGMCCIYCMCVFIVYMYLLYVCIYCMYVCIYCMYVINCCMNKVTSDDSMFCGSFHKTAVFMVRQSFAELCFCERFKALCVPPAEFCLHLGVEENLQRGRCGSLAERCVTLKKTLPASSLESFFIECVTSVIQMS